jgi:hypothetical protein
MTTQIDATDMCIVLVKLVDGEDEDTLECKYQIPASLQPYAKEIASQLRSVAQELYGEEEFN